MPKPTAVVEQFLNQLAAGKIDSAVDLLATDVEYSNVSLPTVRGRERVRRLANLTLGRPGAGFEVCNHAISATGGSVLTERTDALILGRLRIQFWVCGRFDVENGEIVLWRDRFDWMNYTVATLRGVIGIFVPALRAKMPKAPTGSNRCKRLCRPVVLLLVVRRLVAFTRDGAPLFEAGMPLPFPLRPA